MLLLALFTAFLNVDQEGVMRSGSGCFQALIPETSHQTLHQMANLQLELLMMNVGPLEEPLNHAREQGIKGLGVQNDQGNLDETNGRLDYFAAR